MKKSDSFFPSYLILTFIVWCFTQRIIDWSGRRRLQREQHELKTPQTSLLVEEADAMPAECVRRERKSYCTEY